MSSQLIGLKIKRFFDEVVTLTKSRGHWFESSRGSHPHRSIMQPMPKSLVLQGFFGFLGQNF